MHASAIAHAGRHLPLWLRRSECLSLRITLSAQREEDKIRVRTEATVDYAKSAYGVLLPVAVRHRELSGNALIIEDPFEYSSFHQFAAASDVKFLEEPAETSPKP